MCLLEFNVADGCLSQSLKFWGKMTSQTVGALFFPTKLLLCDYEVITPDLAAIPPKKEAI